jgi:hypothetical protein
VGDCSARHEKIFSNQKVSLAFAAYGTAVAWRREQKSAMKLIRIKA